MIVQISIDDAIKKLQKEKKHANTRKWQKEHPEKCREYDKKRYREQPKRREDCKKWSREHPEEYKAGKLRWQREHPETHTEASKKWNKEHPENCKTSWKKYVTRNPEKRKEIVTNWRKHNPEKVLETWRRKNNKRKRELSFYPLNKHFAGSNAHYLNKIDVVYIPKELHKQHWHDHNKPETMVEINRIALEWLYSGIGVY